jgi:MFS family permease
MTTLATRLRERRGDARGASAFDPRLYAPMMLGAILNPINSSMIAVSLVPIGIAFGAPPSQTAWLVSALYLATSIGQPVVGRLIDSFGPRRLYLVSTALVGVAGLLGTLAPSFAFLVLARVLLGFGTCAGYPAAMYLIRSESRRTGRDSPQTVLTLLTISTQIIAVIGPSLGGLLIGLGGWRSIFAVNIPLSIAALALGAWRLPKATPRREGDQRPGLDLPGIALFAAMMLALLLFLMSPALGHWYLPVLVLATGAGFVLRELRTAEPFIDVRVLGGNLPLVATYGRTVLAYVVSYAFLYGYTQWLEQGRGLSASQAGLVLLPIFGAGIVVASITGRYREVRLKLLVGSVAQILACALLLLLTSTSAIWLLLAITVVLGVPQGLNSLANQNAVYHQADPTRIGSSAGLLRTFMYLGAIVAAAANGHFYGQHADSAGLHHLAAFMLVVAVAFFVLTVVDRSLRRIGRQPTEPADAEPAVTD